MLSKLSDRLGKLLCGLSPPSTATTPSDADPPPRAACGGGGGLSSPLLFPSVSQQEGLRGCLPPPPSSSSRPAPTDEGDDEVLLPCLAFGSEDGYRVFSMADNRMLEDGAEVRMRLARGRRVMPSSLGGKVFATDMCGLLNSHLADPFTGARTPLPGLPVPLCQEEPMPAQAHEPEPNKLMNTDDAFAWDLSPHGAMVARGDTVFFSSFSPGSGGDGWVPVHRSRDGSAMTVNCRGGFFFVLELGALVTTVIDAGTLEVAAVIDPPPHRGEIFHAILVTSAGADEVLLLTLRRGRYRYDDDSSKAYRARLDGREQPRWEPVKDIGDRAAFVDTRHGFAVRAGERARRNCVYMAMRKEELDDDGSTQHGGGVVARHVIKVAPLGELIVGWELDEGSDQLGRFKVKQPA
ncbi:hypothetical protein BRADI_3g14900v3, partial [Brachypodium distachyon]